MQFNILIEYFWKLKHVSLPFHYEFAVRLEKGSAFLHPFSILIVDAALNYRHMFSEDLVSLFGWAENLLELNKLKILLFLFLNAQRKFAIKLMPSGIQKGQKKNISSDFGEYAEFFFSSHLELPFFLSVIKHTH